LNGLIFCTNPVFNSVKLLYRKHDDLPGKGLALKQATTVKLFYPKKGYTIAPGKEGRHGMLMVRMNNKEK
jgi:hypothetical protein